MYIEEGYKGQLGLWKYFVIPVGFLLLIVANYILTAMSPIPVDVMMQDSIDQFGKNVVFILLLAPLAFGLLLVLGWTLLVHKQSITSLTTFRKKIDWNRIIFSFVLWGVLSAAMILIGVYMSPEDYVFNFKLKPFLFLAIIGILLVPLQTSFEEYLFTLFGLMHLGNPEVGKLGMGIMVYYIGTGFFLGILTLMDEGLELALGFHAANNLVGALLLTADWTAFQTDSIYRDVSNPELGWDVFVPVLIIYPILLFIMAKKYGWKNWKDRLAGKVLSKEVWAVKTANELESH